MKRIIFSIVMAIVLISLITAPVFAAGKSGMSGKSNVGHVYLVEKDPSNWTIIEDGAWGKFNYKLSGEGESTQVSGVFNGHGLEAELEYSLIYFPETRPEGEWPWGVIVLGSAEANRDGNVHIRGGATIGLPDEHNNPNDIDYYPYDLGDKIWLVLTRDLVEVDTDVWKISGWNPTEYLFEDDLINTGD